MMSILRMTINVLNVLKMVNVNILKIMMGKNIYHCILMAKERRGEKYKEVQKKTIIKQKYNDADYDDSDI